MQDITNVHAIVQEFLVWNKNPVIIVRWATATWKTSLSLDIAEKFPIEIIGADSRQLFRGMDIWTDKISTEIRVKIPHHQIDIINPDQHYTAWQWKFATQELIANIHKRWNIPVIVWWTGLYIDTIYKNFSMPEISPDYDLRDKLYKKEENEPGILWKELNTIDPDEAHKHHPNSVRYIVRALEIYYISGKTKTELFTAHPPKWPLLMLGLRREKDDTNRRINKRIHEMFDEWLVEEVQWLLDAWYSPELQSMQGIGYKEVVDYIQWTIDRDKCEELIKKNTHYLAKKQRTWFRRYIADSKLHANKNIIYMTYYL